MHIVNFLCSVVTFKYPFQHFWFILTNSSFTSITIFTFQWPVGAGRYVPLVHPDRGPVVRSEGPSQPAAHHRLGPLAPRGRDAAVRQRRHRPQGRRLGLQHRHRGRGQRTVGLPQRALRRNLHRERTVHVSASQSK